MYTTEQLFRDCARQGRLNRIKEDVYAQVWEFLFPYVRRQLSLGKGVILPGLGRFAIHHKRDQSNKAHRIPTFVVSDGWISGTGLRVLNRPYVKNDIPMSEINCFAVAQQAQLPKDVVSTVVRQFIQRIGEVISTGKKVSLDFQGMGTLLADHAVVEYRVNNSYAEEFDAAFSEAAERVRTSSRKENGVEEQETQPRDEGTTSASLAEANPSSWLQQSSSTTNGLPATEMQQQAQPSQQRPSQVVRPPPSRQSVSSSRGGGMRVSGTGFSSSKPSTLKSASETNILVLDCNEGGDGDMVASPPSPTNSELLASLHPRKSIIGPPFSTSEERGRRHVGYNTQTQYSASDLLQAHDEKMQQKEAEKAQREREKRAEFDSVQQATRAAFLREQQKRDEAKLKKLADTTFNLQMAANKHASTRKEKEEMHGETYSHWPFTDEESKHLADKSRNEQYRRDLEHQMEAFAPKSLTKRDIQALRRAQKQEEIEALRQDLMRLHPSSARLSRGVRPSTSSEPFRHSFHSTGSDAAPQSARDSVGKHGDTFPHETQSFSASTGGGNEALMLSFNLPSQGARGSCARLNKNAGAVNAAMQRAMERYQAQVQREQQEESFYMSQDAIQADLARKKDEEMRRLKQEKRKHLCTVLKAQIDDKTRVDPRPPSMDLSSIKVFPVDFQEESRKIERNNAIAKNRADLQEQMRERREQAYRHKEAEIVEDLLEAEKARLEEEKEKELAKSRKIESTHLLAEAWQQQSSMNRARRGVTLGQPRPGTGSMRRRPGTSAGVGSPLMTLSPRHSPSSSSVVNAQSSPPASQAAN